MNHASCSSKLYLFESGDFLSLYIGTSSPRPSAPSSLSPAIPSSVLLLSVFFCISSFFFTVVLSRPISTPTSSPELPLEPRCQAVRQDRARARQDCPRDCVTPCPRSLRKQESKRPRTKMTPKSMTSRLSPFVCVRPSSGLSATLLATARAKMIGDPSTKCQQQPWMPQPA